MAISIRKADKGDMPTVLKMMNDLAIVLKVKGPKCTVEDLYRDGGFEGEMPFFFVLLAEDSDNKDTNGLPTPIGFALFSHSFSWDGRTIYLRNLLVYEAYRSRGVGKLIFEAVMRYAKGIGANRLEFHVSANNTARQFYQKMGAINVSEKEGHVYYRLFRDVLNKLDN